MNPNDTLLGDADECLALLKEQRDLLQRMLSKYEDVVGGKNPELVLFFFLHSWNIFEMAKAAILLMEGQEPFAVAVVARSALESAFNIRAATRNPTFAIQKVAYEYEEIAKKKKLFIRKGVWKKSRGASPEHLRKAAAELRRKHSVLPEEFKQVEKIAQLAGLTPYYESDYRLLCMHAHANQAGIADSGEGLLCRVGLLAISNSLYVAGVALGWVGDFKTELSGLKGRMETLMKKPC
jgi:Family of unknown function (DUF5677)